MSPAMIAPKQKDDSGEGRDETSTKPCPICGKPAAFAIRPFCSKRCADIDLHRWLGGAYAITSSDEPDDEAKTMRKEASDQDSRE